MIGGFFSLGRTIILDSVCISSVLSRLQFTAGILDLKVDSHDFRKKFSPQFLLVLLKPSI